MKSINPYNNQLLKEFEVYSESSVGRCISTADAAFESWKETSFEHRSKLMKNCAEVLPAG